jgi:thiamine-phosphate pyrophosphorylase
MSDTIHRLHYISQQASDGSHLTAIHQALEAGCKWIQLRIKDQNPDEILRLAIKAKTFCQVYNAKLILNDYPEIAAKVQADGLHLGLEDMPITEARKIVGPDMIIGGTANTIEHIQQRIQEGANYVGLGPFRFTKTKAKLSPILGIQGYRDIVRQLKEHQLDIPIIAIGGILPEDLDELLTAGVYGVAMSGAITFSSNPKTTVQAIHQKLQLC